MKILPAIFLLLLACIGLALEALVVGVEQVVAPAAPLAPPTAADGVCSENPYYAKAIVAMSWLESNPPLNPMSGDQYSHAVLDSLYDQLYAEGKVGPVPPPCQVTARDSLTVYTTPDAASAPVWTLAAGESLDVYGRNDGDTWFQVVTPGGWGWVRADAVNLQMGAEVDRMPILG